MPIPHQIAQKLHAVSEEGIERAHDLIDLQIIGVNETIDYSLTKNVCTRLFNFRKLQAWPPAVVKGDNWDSLYTAQVGDLDVFANVDEAIAWANDFIHTIDSYEFEIM